MYLFRRLVFRSLRRRIVKYDDTDYHLTPKLAVKVKLSCHLSFKWLVGNSLLYSIAWRSLNVQQ